MLASDKRPCSSSMWPSLFDTSTWLSSSHSDPIARRKNLAISFGVPRPAPSAIFELTDTAARRICVTKPNRSSVGNALVNW